MTLGCIRAFACGAGLAIASVASAGGSVTVPDDQPTIQDGIDAASNGDTVFVRPNTYNETLDFTGKSIDMVSTDGAAMTTINGGMAGGVIMSGDGVTVTIDGFTITGGDSMEGGAVRVGDGADVTVLDCMLTGNVALRGGAVYVAGGTATIARCRIVDNFASQFGGAVHSIGTTDIASCLLLRNSSGLIGGQVLSSGPVMRMDGCTVVNGTSGQSGGIFVDQGNASVSNSILHGNADSTGNSEPAQISSLSTVEVRFSLIDSLSEQRGDEGDGLLTGDPGFNDPSTDNFTLAPDSPCIDSGDSTVSLTGVTTADLEGNGRVVDDPGTDDTGIADGMGRVVDMGAFEVVPVCGDASGDGMINFTDLDLLLAQWATVGPEADFDESGLVDFGDLNLLLDQWGTICPGSPEEM